MDLWEKMVCPVRKVLFAVAARVRSRKNGASLLKLHSDIQTCGYADVQVMWEMLQRSESEFMSQRSKQNQRSFWRIFIWHNHDSASSFSINHA
ncbi:hypothetical protein DCAR_0518675 [Daucus carota subsp. sativus]|uniref:Uncharacterized protein n=1 Tax=Daucus carota subsp. sativus TaxID=79200 RepID=A0A164XEU3_DAUCS|nr:hypothetical protein DCAR_0518675 [Daucus carota subsp. sativus]